jgi:hypothetical protein
MDLSLDALREQADRLLTQVARREYQHATGRTAKLSTSDLYTEFSGLKDAQTFFQIEHWYSGAPEPSAERRRLAAWLDFLAVHIERTHGALDAERISDLETSPEFSGASDHELLSLRAALASMPSQPDRQGRAGLERAIDHFLADNRALYARRYEAALLTARQLERPSYRAVREMTAGFSLAGLLQQCEDVLSRTADAYRDLLSYALKRLDSSLRPLPSGDAQRHDLQRATAVPWMIEHFAWANAIPAFKRLLADWGFEPYAAGRITVDSGGSLPSSALGVLGYIGVPAEVWLALPPVDGLDAYGAALHGWGAAQFHAGQPASALFEERRLKDPATSEALGKLFRHRLLDPAWHRRYLRLTQRVAKEAAQMSAFRELVWLRQRCALLPFEIALYEGGPTESTGEEIRERQADVLLAAVPSHFWQVDSGPPFSTAAGLRAAALEAAIHRALEQRFNEDYWRNPSAGGWLLDLFGRASATRAEDIAQELGASISLQAAEARLLAAVES